MQYTNLFLETSVVYTIYQCVFQNFKNFKNFIKFQNFQKISKFQNLKKFQEISKISFKFQNFQESYIIKQIIELDQYEVLWSRVQQY